MGVYFEQRDGLGFQGSVGYPVTAVSGNVVTFSQELVGGGAATVGRALWIYNAGPNNGPYTITEFISAAKYRVQPTPNQVVSGNGRLFALNTVKQAWVDVDIFNAGQIVASGADFLAYPCHENDRAAVKGATSNNGAFYVTEVVDSITLNVQPLNGQATVSAEAVPGGCQVQVRQGAHVIRVSGQATSDWDDVYTNAVASPQLGSGTDYFAAGVISDYVTRKKWGQGHGKDSWETIGIGRVDLERVSGCVFESQNEAVMAMDSTGAVNRAVVPQGAGALQYLRLGSDGGGNENAAQDGSAWFNYGLLSDNRVYHSYVWTDGGNQMAGNTSEMVGSVIRDGIFFAPASVRVDSCTFGPSGFSVFTTGSDFENVHLGRSTGGSIFNFGPQITVTVEGLLMSDLIPVGGMWLLYGLTLNILNSREDYSVAQLFGNVFSNAIGARLYTYNPRFVAWDSIAGAPVPVEGLKVSFYQDIQIGAGYGLINTYTTNAQGQLSGIETDRTGINLTKGINYQGTPLDNWEHYLTVQGNGRRYIRQNINLESRQDFDFPVDGLLTDFEGEVST